MSTRPPVSALTDDRSWSFAEVAYFLNVSESTVRNLERDGTLPALPRIGRRVNFDPKVVRAFRDGWRPSGVRRPLPLADVRSLPGRE
jgi:predicted DNA-binding transcriptional regulator AlpA